MLILALVPGQETAVSRSAPLRVLILPFVTFFFSLHAIGQDAARPALLITADLTNVARKGGGLHGMLPFVVYVFASRRNHNDTSYSL